jgi:hemerythrin-like metal-binding protein
MDKRYLLGISEIDKHHSNLFDLIDKLSEKVGCNSVTFDELDQIHTELAQYASFHLSYEEGLMRECDFYALDKHVLQHEQFKTKLDSIFVHSDDVNLRLHALDVLLALNSWFYNHVLKQDVLYVPYVRAKRPDLVSME